MLYALLFIILFLVPAMSFSYSPCPVLLSMDFWQSEEQKQNLSSDFYEKESTEF